MFRTIRRWFRNFMNRNFGTDFQHTVAGLEMIFPNLDFDESENIIRIDGKILIRSMLVADKGSDGLFIIPDKLVFSGRSYFIKFDGSIFVEHKS